MPHAILERNIVLLPVWEGSVGSLAGLGSLTVGGSFRAIFTHIRKFPALGLERSF